MRFPGKWIIIGAIALVVLALGAFGLAWRSSHLSVSLGYAMDVSDIVDPPGAPGLPSGQQSGKYVDPDTGSGYLEFTLVRGEVLAGVVEAKASSVSFEITDEEGAIVRDALVPSGDSYWFSVRAQKTLEILRCHFVYTGDAGGALFRFSRMPTNSG